MSKIETQIINKNLLLKLSIYKYCDINKLRKIVRIKLNDTKISRYFLKISKSIFKKLHLRFSDSANLIFI